MHLTIISEARRLLGLSSHTAGISLHFLVAANKARWVREQAQQLKIGLVQPQN